MLLKYRELAFALYTLPVLISDFACFYEFFHLILFHNLLLCFSSTVDTESTYCVLDVDVVFLNGPVR